MVGTLGTIWGYGRASTDRQTMTLMVQETRCYEYFQYRLKAGDINPVYGGFFPDAATSGKVPLFERDTGIELFKRIREGDTIVVTRLDRAFRNSLDMLSVFEIMVRLKADIHIIANPGLTLHTAEGKMMLTVLGAMAEFEREMASSRTKEIFGARKKQGLPCTRSSPNGWMQVKEDGVSRFVPDHEKRRFHKLIARLRDRVGMSVEEISLEVEKHGHVSKTGMPVSSSVISKGYWSFHAKWPKVLPANGVVGLRAYAIELNPSLGRASR